jgi:hypothetical protein
MRAWILVVAGCYASTEPPFKAPDLRRVPRTFDYSAICQSIADEIAGIRASYPQLVEFEPTASDCTITYAHHTHAATHAGGWTAGVPNPDPDGVWFYIGVWDPADPAEASSQINTQPMVPERWIGKRRVTYLILEGDRTTRVGDELLSILKHHEMTER